MSPYHEEKNAHWRNIVKYWWCGTLSFCLVVPMFDGTIQNNFEVFSQITPIMVLQNVVAIFIVAFSCLGLLFVHPIFQWSWFCLFNKRQEEGGSDEPQMNGTNIHLIPLQVKYFGLFFAVLLCLNLPSMAMYEEKLFRNGTAGWIQGIIFSLIFGMVHCLVGVPIAAGVAISIAGLWYTHQYFVGGVELSALHHTTFNLILISILFVCLVCKHFAELNPKNQTTK